MTSCQLKRQNFFLYSSTQMLILKSTPYVLQFKNLFKSITVLWDLLSITD